MPTTANSYGPYDAGAGANITEAFWRTFMSRLAPSAVLAGVSNELAPSGDSTGMQVKVATGAAWVRGAYGEWTGITTLPIAAVGGIAGGQSRIDSIIVRNDFVSNRVELDVLTGTAGVSPVAPTLTQSSSIWEILLGNVGSMTNATTTITAAMVSDGRWKMTPSGILYHEVSLTGTTVTLPGAGGIPSGYRDLAVLLYGRTDKAAVTREVIDARFNLDTGTNYTWSAISATDSTTVSGSSPSTGQTSMAIGNLPAATATASVPGQIWIDIPEYANTSFVRTLLARSGQHNGTTNYQIGLFHGNWTSTAALTSLTLFTGAGGSYVAGSRARIEMRP
jgi:hypothetical protein